MPESQPSRDQTHRKTVSQIVSHLLSHFLSLSKSAYSDFHSPPPRFHSPSSNNHIVPPRPRAASVSHGMCVLSQVQMDHSARSEIPLVIAPSPSITGDHRLFPPATCSDTAMLDWFCPIETPQESVTSRAILISVPVGARSCVKSAIGKNAGFEHVTSVPRQLSTNTTQDMFE